MIFREHEESGGFALDFGRGSREQTQGRTRPDNVHPIRKPVDLATRLT
ncbi:MAG TPA: hypothetical protein VH331_17460 [Allosphingosinicella sp.]|jgi:hypothetical protein|nr:hypothetical protein [Allosphingosinicella sp.]